MLLRSMYNFKNNEAVVVYVCNSNTCVVKAEGFWIISYKTNKMKHIEKTNLCGEEEWYWYFWILMYDVTKYSALLSVGEIISISSFVFFHV